MSLAHGSSIVKDGLVLHLDAANVKSYPGSGTIWKDLSGNGNNGVMTNGPTFSSVNRSISFDGVDDVVVFSDAPFRFNAPSFSICAVFYWTNVLQLSTICGKRNGSPYNQYGLVINDDVTTTTIGRKINFFARRDALGNDINLSYVLPNNSGFFIVAATLDQNLQNLYVNGVNEIESVVNLTGSTYNISNRSFTVGAIANDANNGYLSFFPSLISQISVYNRALTELEVKQNFEALRGRYGI